MGQKEFDAVLQKVHDMDAAYVLIPFDIGKEYGEKGQIKVKAKIDGELYRGSLVNMGYGTMLGIRQDIRKKIGKNPGDIVHIILEEDLEERKVEIPQDLKEMFIHNMDAERFFNTLSYTNQKEYVKWITNAILSETRADRLEKTIRMLMNKKRNPFDK
jgi:hypothetical protein